MSLWRSAATFACSPVHVTRTDSESASPSVPRRREPQRARASTLAEMRSHAALPDSAHRLSGEGAAFEECEHIVHDDDPDTALCGIDQTGVPWNQGFPICRACVAVAQGRMS